MFVYKHSVKTQSLFMALIKAYDPFQWPRDQKAN